MKVIFLSVLVATIMVWLIDANIRDRKLTPEERAKLDRDSETW